MPDSMRSMNSFGVAGMIAANGEILYSNELRARNVGRVSDLLSAKLRPHEVDELNVRCALNYGIFLSYAVRGIGLRHVEQVEPVSVELGLDEAQVAVGVCFHWRADRVPLLEGLTERVSRRMGSNPFEKILECLVEQSTQVIVRYEKKERRLEVVTLYDRQNARAKEPFTLLEVDSGSAPLLEVSRYTELGDLDYSSLLRQPESKASATEKTGTEETVVRGAPSGTEEEFRSDSPKTESGEEVRRVSGTSTKEVAEEFRFAGGEEPDDTGEARPIPPSQGGPIGALEARVIEGEHTAVMIEEYERTIGELRDTVQSLERRLEHGAPGAGTGADGIAGGSDEKRAVVKGGEPPRDAEAILQALQNLASEARSKKIDETFREIESAVDEKRARKWLDTLTTELIQEKGRLAEIQKELSRQVSKREIDFKAAESAMTQQLKHRDDLLRQRDFQIEQRSEQLAQANLTIERLNSRATDREAQQLKAKLERTQRIAQMKEEETKSLVSKIRDLENRLIVAQAKSQKGNDAQAQNKIQGLERKLEEYKRINSRLMETLNSQRDASNDKENSELRRRVEQLDRSFSEAKRALERANFKVRDLQETEKRMQAEASRMLEENRHLRKAQARSGDDDGGSAPGGDQVA